MSENTYRYIPLFCEENIWQLASTLLEQGRPLQEVDVVVLSNPQGHVAIRSQKAVPEGEYMVWDYHVILVDRGAGQVYDFDSRLPFPARLSEYLSATLPDVARVLPEFIPEFRVVPAADYLAHFCSDRGHMKGVVPESEFPEWPAIRCEGLNRPVPLARYRDPGQDIPGSACLGQKQFVDYCLDRDPETASK